MLTGLKARRLYLNENIKFAKQREKLVAIQSRTTESGAGAGDITEETIAVIEIKDEEKLKLLSENDSIQKKSIDINMTRQLGSAVSETEILDKMLEREKGHG